MAGPRQTRRSFIQAGLLGVGAFAVGSGLPRYAFGAPATEVASPYGALGAYNANGIALPSGFSSREVARAGVNVENTAYPWHALSDGMGTFPEIGGDGWWLVSNRERNLPNGGCSSI